MTQSNSSLKKRLATAAVLLPLLIVFLVYSQSIHVLILFGVLIGVSSYEAARMVLPTLHRKLGGDSIEAKGYVPLLSYQVCVGVSVVLYSLIVLNRAPSPSGAIVGAMLLSMMAGLLFSRKGEEPLANILGFTFVIAYATMPWLAMWNLYAIGQGSEFLMFGLAVVWGGDTGAYFGGRKFGKRKLAETLSPNKTLEGAAFGLLGSFACGQIVNLAFGMSLFTWVDCALLSIVAGAFGQMGDLFESALKRFSNVKDSGGMFPGHGGFLDRVDGLMFGVPMIWFLMALLNLNGNV